MLLDCFNNAAFQFPDFTLGADGNTMTFAPKLNINDPFISVLILLVKKIVESLISSSGKTKGELVDVNIFSLFSELITEKADKANIKKDSLKIDLDCMYKENPTGFRFRLNNSVVPVTVKEMGMTRIIVDLGIDLDFSDEHQSELVTIILESLKCLFVFLLLNFLQGEDTDSTKLMNRCQRLAFNQMVRIGIPCKN